MTFPAAFMLVVQLAQPGLAGVVRDELSGRPLSDVVVELPDLAARTTTDSNGRFRFVDLAPGPHHLVVTRQGFSPRTLHALVPRSGEIRVDVSLAPEPLELDGLVVEPRLPLRGLEPLADDIARQDAVPTTVLRDHPLLSEPDVFRVLEGGDVAAQPESQSGLHVRGGASSHTAFDIDGVPVLGAFHAAGLFGAWNPDALASVRLDRTPMGATPALSGSISAVTRTPGLRAGGSAALSTTQGRVTLDGPLPGSSAGYVVSLRRGFPSSMTAPQDPAKLRGEVGDLLVKLESGGLGGIVSLLAYSSDNEITAGVIADAPTARLTDPRNEFEWQAQSFGMAWERATGAWDVEVRAWEARGLGTALVRGAPDEADVRSERAERGVSAILSREPDTSRPFDVARRIMFGARVAHGSTAYEARTPLEFGGTGGLSSASVMMSYGQRVAGPLRFDVDVDLSRTRLGLLASPHLETTLEFGPKLTLSASLSARHQFAQSLRNEESLLGTVFPTDLFLTAGSGGVPVARADEMSMGVEVLPAAGVQVRGDVYERRLRDVIFVAPETGTLFSSGAFRDGSTSVRGLALDASLAGSRYGVLIDYGFQDVENRLASGSYVPSYAPRHRAQLGLVVYPTASVSVRLGNTGMWGRRATALTGAVEWEACNLADGGCELAGLPTHGEALGEVRLGAYFRTDLGLRKHWHVEIGRRDSMISVYGTVTNVLNRSNTLNYVIDPLSGTSSRIDMLPLSPLVLGLEVTF